MVTPEEVDRAAVVQCVFGCDHVVIASRLDGSERIYAIGTSDAYSTMLFLLAGDAAATNVGTRALIDAIENGRAWPCSMLPRCANGEKR